MFAVLKFLERVEAVQVGPTEVLLEAALDPGRRRRTPRRPAYPICRPPISNLWVSLLEILGTPVKTFGDSTGKIDI